MLRSNLTDSDADVELGVYNDGYPALAHWMAQDPDSETLIFRKFDSLSVRNLLYLQAELFDIEGRLLKLEKQISKRRDITLMESARRWETFIENAEGPNVRPEQEMMELVVKMRKKLKEYRKSYRNSLPLLGLKEVDEALILQSQVASLGQPSNRALRFFMRWFQGDSRDLKGAKPFPIIDGEAKKMLDDDDDLAALKVPEDDDRLSQLLRDHWPLQVSTCLTWSAFWSRMLTTYLGKPWNKFWRQHKILPTSACVAHRRCS